MDKNELIDVLAEWCNSEELSFGESGRLGDVIDKALEDHVIVPVVPGIDIITKIVRIIDKGDIVKRSEANLVESSKAIYVELIKANKE